MWRVYALPFLAGLRSVSGAIFDPNGQSHLGHRGGQIAFDICCQRLERRDVERMEPVMRAVSKINKGWQKARQCLAATGWRDQQECRSIGAIEHLLLVRVNMPALGGKPVFEERRQCAHKGLCITQADCGQPLHTEAS